MPSVVRIGRQQSFGRREVKQPAAPVRSGVAPVLAEAASADESTHRSILPFFTFALVAVLTIIFLVEVRISAASGQTLSIDGHAFVMLGGLGRALVTRQHEWWRFFTAPWLHGGLDHLVGNSTVLIVVGVMLERLIGRAWLAAAFLAGAWGGSVGSLAFGGPNVVASLGASGAIMGLVALLFTLSFHSETAQRARWHRRVALFLLIPALLPTVAHNGVQTDIGAHFGGAAAGTAMGFLLLIIWPETGEKPPHSRLAAASVMLALALTLASFTFDAAAYPSYAELNAKLAPNSQLQQLVAERRTGDLVELYPHDPVVRFARANQYLVEHDSSSAIDEIHAALDEYDTVTIFYPPLLRQELQALLAAIFAHDNRLDDARSAASELCLLIQNPELRPTDDGYFSQELDYLQRRGVCG